MKTTLNAIREFSPCEDSWKKLLHAPPLPRLLHAPPLPRRLKTLPKTLLNMMPRLPGPLPGPPEPPPNLPRKPNCAACSHASMRASILTRRTETMQTLRRAEPSTWLIAPPGKATRSPMPYPKGTPPRYFNLKAEVAARPMGHPTSPKGTCRG